MENCRSADSLPRIDRPDARLVVLGQWRAGAAGTQHAVVEAAARQWQRVAWPVGLLLHTVFAGSDGYTIAHYAQPVDEQAFRGFAAKREWAAGIDAIAPGTKRFGVTPYRLYRSVWTGEQSEPGCVVMVRFTVETTAQATEWVDALIDAGRDDNPPAGMLSAHFHISLTGNGILNYAEWVDAISHETTMATRDQHADNNVVKIVDGTPGVRFAGVDRFTYWRSTSAPA